MVHSHPKTPQSLLDLLIIVEKMMSLKLSKISNEMVICFYYRCPHCQKFAPIFKEAALRAQGLRLNVFFAKVFMRLTTSCGLSSINVFFFPLV